MSEAIGPPVLIAAAIIGLIAVILIMRRERRTDEASTTESPYAAASEGEERCPKCGMGNLWSDDRCVSCGSPLPKRHPPTGG